MQGLKSQKSLISHTQVADLRPCSYACAKKETSSFPHLHTIKLCSEPLRRMKMSRKTYERVCVVLTNKDRKYISKS